MGVLRAVGDNRCRDRAGGDHTRNARGDGARPQAPLAEGRLGARRFLSDPGESPKISESFLKRNDRLSLLQLLLQSLTWWLNQNLFPQIRGYIIFVK